MHCLLNIIIASLVHGAWAVPRSWNPSFSYSIHIRGGAKTEDDHAVIKDTADSSSSSSDVARTMYDKQSNNWVRSEPRCLSDFTGRPVVFSMLEPHVAGATILDVGCGEGYCARKVIEMGAAKVMGSDISSEMIEKAIAASEGDCRFKFYFSSCTDLLKDMEDHRGYLEIKGTAEGSVDVAIAVFLFNYLTSDEMSEAVAQIYSALKPGGIFIFSVPHPSMIFCHDKDAIFRLESEGKGYFSSRNEKILGHISTVDGVKLNIMSVHKTLNDYIKAIKRQKFDILDIQEAGVTDKHLEMNRKFFETVQDRPLHLIFKLRKV